MTREVCLNYEGVLMKIYISSSNLPELNGLVGSDNCSSGHQVVDFSI